jgi:hypothetical protein
MDLGFIAIFLTFCHSERSEESYKIDRSAGYLSCVHVPRRRFFALAQNDKGD